MKQYKKTKWQLRNEWAHKMAAKIQKKVSTQNSKDNGKAKNYER